MTPFYVRESMKDHLKKKLKKKKLVELKNDGMSYHYCFPTFVCLELYTVTILKNQ